MAVYLDHNATSPLHPEVAEAMAEALRAGAGGLYGNPSSLHASGREARRRVEEARESVAALIGAHPSEIVFTGGGTEANNLALQGALAALSAMPASPPSAGRHLVVSSFEHPSVLETARSLEARGYQVSWVDPDGDGVVQPDKVSALLRPDTVLASVMAANNEVGLIQPVKALGSLLRGRGVAFHCDAVQALGKLAGEGPRDWQADYASFSAHKINGPKGVGALYVRKGAPLKGLSLGGPQERRMRGGTENVPGIVGFGKAAEVWARIGAQERLRLGALRDTLEAELRKRLPDLAVNAGAAHRLPNTLNVSLPGCASDLLVMGLDMRGVEVSAGSACASGAVKHSHVILAMGKGKAAASSSLRFSLGLGNSEAEIVAAAEAVAAVAAAVRVAA